MATDGSVVPTFNIANILTISRLVLVPVFIWLFLQEGLGMRVAATAVFVVAAVTDQLDGHLARSRGLITDLGKLLDPIADKALTLSAIVLLSVEGTVPWWVTILILVRELGITLMRMAMVRRAVMAASAGGKLKTVLQMTFIVGMLIPWNGFLLGGVAGAVDVFFQVVMYVALAVTVVTGLMYVADAMRIVREQT